MRKRVRISILSGDASSTPMLVSETTFTRTRNFGALLNTHTPRRLGSPLESNGSPPIVGRDKPPPPILMALWKTLGYF